MNYLVMGPWRHSQVNYDGSHARAAEAGTATPRCSSAATCCKPFFDQYLKDGAPKADTPPVFIYNTGENHWDRLQNWPLACETGCAAPIEAALSDSRTSGLSFDAPAARAAAAYDEYVSDPAKPVPYRAAAGALRRRRRAGARGW